MTPEPPAHLATVHGLIVDTQGRWLIVRAVDDWPFWHLPGGLIGQTERPSAACRRVLRAHLGLDLTPTRLHMLGWVPPPRPDRYASLTMVFHMGVHDTRLGAAISLADMLDDWQWAHPSIALSVLRPRMAERLHEAGLALPLTIYIEPPP